MIFAANLKPTLSALLSVGDRERAFRAAVILSRVRMCRNSGSAAASGSPVADRRRRRVSSDVIIGHRNSADKVVERARPTMRRYVCSQ